MKKHNLKNKQIGDIVSISHLVWRDYKWDLFHTLATFPFHSNVIYSNPYSH